MNLEYMALSGKKIVSLIDQIINPTFCAYCKTFDITHGALLCQGCVTKIQPIVSHDVYLSTQYTLTVCALSAYQEPLKSLVLAKTHADIATSRQLGSLLWTKSYIRNTHPDYFVPIPLHWRRYAVRGYNQAHEMSLGISAESGLPTVELMRRTKNTRVQAGLSANDRQENLHNAFELLSGVNSLVYRDKHLVLVDDLFTTGATLKQAARLLMHFKPRKISVLVVCRVI